MAKPDLEDGWFKLAYELDAALAFAGFSDHAQTILRYVRAQTFGKSKAMYAKLTTHELATRTGITRQNVVRAFRELSDCGALVEVREHRYRFVKDYEKWTKRSKSRDFSSPKVARLTAAQIADCKAAPEYAKVFLPEESASPKPSPKLASSGESNGIHGESRRIQKRIPLDSKVNPVGFTPPIEEPARNGELENGELERDRRAGRPDDRSWETDDAEGRLAAMIVARYLDEDNGPFYRSQAHLFLSGYPEEVIHDALLEAFTKTAHGKGALGYITKSLPTHLARRKAVEQGSKVGAGPSANGHPPSPARAPSFTERRAEQTRLRNAAIDDAARRLNLETED